MRKLLVSLLGLSAFLILAGTSLLFGRPSSVLAVPTAQSEASVAYGSNLLVAYDVATSGVELFAIVGGILMLSGLMISAAAFGRRLGGRRSPMLSDAGLRKAIAVIMVGILLLVLGIFFVVASQPIVLQDFAFIGGQGQEFDINHGGVVSNGPQFRSPAVGGVLLGAGVALAAGVGGYLLGRRRRVDD